MDALTLDQVRIFLAVVDEGSFARAATRLNRAQSAATYGIQKLEAQVGMALFDRSTYRPKLTEAGRALLSRARRVADEANGFLEAARSLSGGLEPELSIVVDAMFPMAPVASALKSFTENFPTVPPRVYVLPLGAGVELLLDGTCMIGLLQDRFIGGATLKHFPVLSIELITVVASSHPLAAIDGLIETRHLQNHAQLVLTDRSEITAGQEFGVLSQQTWRLADLSAKHSMLVAGLGWGNMPAHMVADDIARGRLKVIRPAEFSTRATHIAMGGAYRSDQLLGPAGRWMNEHLETSIGTP